jgi:hypothetical protein
LPIDVDRGDILNLFVDLKVWDGDGHPVYVRGGRQELLLGSQRLISTLDWANTRRTFQGVRAFRRGEQWDADVFWVQPVIPDATSFDQADSEQNFAGTWLTYRAQKGRFLDLYYLYYGNNNTVTQLNIPRARLIFTRSVRVGRATRTVISGMSNWPCSWASEHLLT